MKRFGIVLSSIGVLCFGLAALQHFVSIQINLSESLPQRFFLVLKNQEFKKGEYVSFYARNNGLYPINVPFIKKVVGTSGDKITEKNRVFSINGKPMALAKPFSKQGRPLVKGPVGSLGDGEYFVYANHKDSFDSRYKNVGWIKKEEIVGKAIPLL